MLIVLKNGAWDPGSLACLELDGKEIFVTMKYYEDGYSCEYDTEVEAAQEFKKAVQALDDYVTRSIR